ncbi:MAG: DUF4335 domain-containing protein [Cyanobacteria bacterium J069]|nr:MAG: DUF4335 domain-containing protein [Cyanobacteria bacterium J069]
MTIQRQYTLPNCKLVVEGLSDGATAMAARPVVSMVTNAECHFAGQPQPISGGRAFLEDLAITVSNYAQGILSGVPHPHTQPGQGELVSLQRVEPDLHRLTVKPDSFAAEANGGAGALPVQVDLRTVQLFDLMEAIDQFLADSQTLPEFAPQLVPVSRRYAVTHEPMTKQVIPAAVGLVGLAAAAAALFFLPIPERRPEAAEEDAATPAPLVSPTTPAASSPPPGPPSPAASPLESPNAAESPAAIAPAAATASPSPAESPIGSPSATPAASGSVDEAFANANEITEPEQLNQLKTQLRDRLDDAWSLKPTFTEDLVYQVSVAENGDILGFRYMNNAAVQNANQTPLPDLQYQQTDRSSEPNALFRVVFTPGGVVQVSPWHGLPSQ